MTKALIENWQYVVFIAWAFALAVRRMIRPNKV